MNLTEQISKEELLKYFLFDDTEDVMERLMNFNRLMMKYRSAIREVTSFHYFMEAGILLRAYKAV